MMGSQMADERTLDEVARSHAEARQLGDLLSLIQELTSTVIRSESEGDLFARAAATLFRCVPFDVIAAVMLEQHLDLFLSTRQGAESLANDELVAKIRATLETLIPVSFASTEIIVRAESHDLPAGEGSVEHSAAVLLQHERRAAGLLFLARAEPFTDREQQILSIFAMQVSMLLDTVRARERILNLADTDDLTGIWNRRYFRRQLPQEIERARTFNVPLSLLLFDIDEFKHINDSFGHVVGDVVLSELCGSVREMLRPTDMIARYGGDEFVIILPHTDLDGARAVSDRILTRVRALTIPADDDTAIRCSISIGLAQFSHDDTADDLFRRADERLYSAKRTGKNRYTA